MKKIPRSVAGGEPSAAGGKEGGGIALATRIKTGAERAAAVTAREAETIYLLRTSLRCRPAATDSNSVAPSPTRLRYVN